MQGHFTYPEALTPQLQLPSITSTILPTTIGSVDFANLQIACKGSDMLDLLTQVVANNTRYAKGHEALDVAIRRFLEITPLDDVLPYSHSLFYTHGYEMPDFANDAHYQGLRYKYIHLRWESDRQDSKPKRPRALGIVPCFHTEHSLIVDNSLTFGTPIIGDNKSFKRAILLQPMKPVGRWQYILAQTERQNKPIYIRVPTGKAVPYWPHMHSPHLLLLAEIAPFITGLSSPGLDNIQKAADDCYRPSISVDVSPSERAISLADENPPSSASSQSWPGYPVLAEIRQLGDWMLKHAAPEDATPPGPLTTTVPLPVHWYEPKSEPPADDFQLLSRYPSQSLRYRGHIPRRELFLFPQPPPPTFTEPPSAHLCPSYHTSTHPEQHSSSKGTHSPPKFTSASPDTFTTLRSSKSMLSLRPITERIRRLSTGGKKERNRRVEQTPCLPISYSTQ